MSADPQVDALQESVEMQRLAISRLTGELTSLADQTADALALLHDQVGTLLGGSQQAGWSDKQVAWCWRDLDPDARQALLDKVRGWVVWLHERYPLSGNIPDCWTEHPEMLEELVAAHAAWSATYESSDASPFAPAEWHERWLPGLEQRLSTRWKGRRCEEGHQPTVRPACTGLEGDHS